MASTLLWASGLDRGTAGTQNTYGLVESDGSPGVGIMAWQASVKQSGDGAYQFVGGNLAGPKVLAEGVSDLFGGTEVWTVASFRFATFQSANVVHLMWARPTDGVLGSDAYPVLAVNTDGRLRIVDSGNAGNFQATTNPLSANTWYTCVLRAVRGASQTQELFIYNADGTLLQSRSITMTTTGSTVTRDARWGLANTVNATGLEFYLDDLAQFSGDTNPLTVRVAPRVPTGTALNEGWTVTGAGTAEAAVVQAPVSLASYVQNAAIATSNSLSFVLNPLSLNPTATVHGVQAQIVEKYLPSSLSYINAGTAAAANNASVTPGLPAGWAQGDLLCCFAGARGSGTLALAGWTQQFHLPIDAGNNRHKVALFWKIATGSESDPTVTYTGGSSGNTVLAQVAAFRGADPTTPFPDQGAIGYTASSQDITPIPGITPTNAGNDGGVIAFGLRLDDWTSVATLTGDLTWAEIGEPSSTLGTDAGIVWDYGFYAGAPPTLSAQTFVVTGGTAQDGGGLMVSLKTAGPPTGRQVGVRIAGTPYSQNPQPYTTTETAKRGLWLTNPVTSSAWTVTDVDGFEGVLQDTDTLIRQFRVASAWWDVVYALPTGVGQPSNTFRLTTDLGIPTGTGSGDQAAAIRAQLVALAPGSIVWLEGFYRIDAPLWIEGTDLPSDITIQNAPELTLDQVGFTRTGWFTRGMTPGTRATAETDQGKILWVRDVRGWIFRGFTINGPHDRPIYTNRYEFATGIRISGGPNNPIMNLLFEDIKINKVGGDFVVVAGNAQNVTVRRLIGNIAGRQAISPTNTIGGIVFEDCDVRQAGRSAADMEPATTTWASQGITFTRCRWESFSNYGIAGGGEGTHRDVRFINNIWRGGLGLASYGRTINPPNTGPIVSGGTFDHRGVVPNWVVTRSGSTYVERTAEAQSDTDAPFQILVTAGDYLYLAHREAYSPFTVFVGTPAVWGGSPTLTWERYNGTAWETFSPSGNTTANFTQTGVITLPSIANTVLPELLPNVGYARLPATVIRYSGVGAAWAEPDEAMPTTAPAIAVGAAPTTLSGEYQAKVTFRYGTSSVNESAGGPVSNILTGITNTSILVTGIPVGGPGVTHVRLYMRSPTRPAYRLVATLTNGVTSYEVTTHESTWGGIDPGCRRAELSNPLGATPRLLTHSSDYLYVGGTSPWFGIQPVLPTLAVGGGALSAEYWNGTIWANLPLTDGTNGFTVTSQPITWTVPGDWATTIPTHGGIVPPTLDSNGGAHNTALYYVRFRCATDPSTAARARFFETRNTAGLWIRVSANLTPSTPPGISAIAAHGLSPSLAIQNSTDILIENLVGRFNTGSGNQSTIGMQATDTGIVRNNIFTSDGGASPVTNIGPGIVSYGNIGIPNTGQPGTLPLPPTSPAVSSITETSLTFSVTDGSTDETGFLGRYRSETPTIGSWVSLPSQAAAGGTGTVISWAITGLQPAGFYRLQAWATNAAGDSAIAETTANTSSPSPPADPSGLASTGVTQTTVGLAWVDNATNEDAYQVQHRLTADAWGGASTTTVNLPPNATSTTITGLVAATSHTFRVRCLRFGVASAYTPDLAVATATPTVPAAPTNLRAISSTQTTLSVVWSDNATDETAYEAEYRISGGGGYTVATTSLPPNTTAYTYTGLTAGTTYDLQVRCASGAGPSAYSNTETFPTLPVAPPNAPTSLAVGTRTLTSVALTWVDNATDEDGYRVEHSQSSTGVWTVTNLAANSQSTTVTGLTPSTSYDFRSRCVRGADFSAYSNTVTTTTLGPPEPVAPSLTSLIAASATRLVWQWGDVSDETGYECSTSPNGSDWTVRVTVSGNATEGIWDGATPGASYLGRVSAVGISGARYHSGSLGVTMPPEQPPPVPSEVSGSTFPRGGPVFAVRQRLSRIRRP